MAAASAEIYLGKKACCYSTNLCILQTQGTISLYFYTTNLVALSAFNQGTIALYLFNSIKLLHFIWTARFSLSGTKPAVSVCDWPRMAYNSLLADITSVSFCLLPIKCLHSLISACILPCSVFGIHKLISLMKFLYVLIYFHEFS
jgi:hypothetical protein